MFLVGLWSLSCRLRTVGIHLAGENMKSFIETVSFDGCGCIVAVLADMMSSEVCALSLV